MNKAKPKRRWRQLSIRGLLIVITFLGIWLGFWTNSARRQHSAAAKIRAMGGELTYAETHAPEWLVQRLGIDYVCGVKNVRISGFHWYRDKPDVAFDMQQLTQAIGAMPSCTGLEISLVKMNDADLQELGSLADQLVLLSLRETGHDQITGVGLALFKNWSRLESLRYNSAEDDPPDLSQLATCPRLKEVTLAGFRMQQEQFADLADCGALTNLSLAYCSFEGEFLKPLRESPKLSRMTLQNCIPRPYVHTWIVGKDGEKTPVAAETFHFIGGDPQFIPTPTQQPSFPNKMYETWKHETLPKITIMEWYMS